MIIVICLIQHDRSVGFFLDDRRWRLSRTITGRPENDEYVQHVQDGRQDYKPKIKRNVISERCTRVVNYIT